MALRKSSLWPAPSARGDVLAALKLGRGRPAVEDGRQLAPIGWAMGAALLVRRDAARAVGGFDEGYFMYSEEVDLLMRLGSTHWVPEAEVVHAGQGTTGDSEERAVEMARSRRRYQELHYSPGRAVGGSGGGERAVRAAGSGGAGARPGGAAVLAAGGRRVARARRPGAARARGGVRRGAAMSVADQPEDVLDSGEAGGRAIRGGALFTGTYVIGLLLSIASVPFMIRHLGVVDYGYYVAVSAIVFIIGGFTEAGLTNLGIREYSQLRPGEREPFLRNLIGLRLVLTTFGVVVATALTAVTGSPGIVVGGVAITGLRAARPAHAADLHGAAQRAAADGLDLDPRRDPAGDAVGAVHPARGPERGPDRVLLGQRGDGRRAGDGDAAGAAGDGAAGCRASTSGRGSGSWSRRCRSRWRPRSGSSTSASRSC